MKRKYIIWVIVILVLMGGAAAYMLWNKPHEKVEDQNATSITATDLADEFLQNEAKANRRYLGQVLEVKGKVIEVTANQDGKTVLLLESTDPLSGVQCTMRDVGFEASTGQIMTVHGFCNGFTTVVLLQDCIQVDK